jgi:hypothetical protein
MSNQAHLGKNHQLKNELFHSISKEAAQSISRRLSAYYNKQENRGYDKNGQYNLREDTKESSQMSSNTSFKSTLSHLSALETQGVQPTHASAQSQTEIQTYVPSTTASSNPNLLQTQKPPLQKETKPNRNHPASVPNQPAKPPSTKARPHSQAAKNQNQKYSNNIKQSAPKPANVENDKEKGLIWEDIDNFINLTEDEEMKHLEEEYGTLQHKFNKTTQNLSHGKKTTNTNTKMKMSSNDGNRKTGGYNSKDSRMVKNKSEAKLTMSEKKTNKGMNTKFEKGIETALLSQRYIY